MYHAAVVIPRSLYPEPVLEMRYRCEGCGLVTGNPTMILICTECSRHFCAACMREHEAAHKDPEP